MDFNLFKTTNYSMDFIPEYVQTRTDDPNLFELDIIDENFLNTQTIDKDYWYAGYTVVIYL